jgi:excisionase family DNA binding protein
VVEHSDLEESFLTVAEVADMLKLNQQTVRNWIDQGSLPALRVGRRVRIKRSDLERVLAEGYSAGGGGATHTGGPSAEDFWGGETVGVAEPGPQSAGDARGIAEPASPSGSDRAAGRASQRHEGISPDGTLSDDAREFQHGEHRR